MVEILGKRKITKKQTDKPIHITYCNMNGNVPKVMEIAEFHPTWISRGKFDENTQFFAELHKFGVDPSKAIASAVMMYLSEITRCKVKYVASSGRYGKI